MSQATCPACGVAVVPGYVRCPKCHRPLPRFARNSTSPVGGTSVAAPKGSPTLAILAAVVVGGGIIAYFALRNGKAAATTPAPGTQIPNTPRAPDEGAPPPSGGGGSIVQPQAPAAPRPDALAADFERTLKRQRLWATVAVVGDHIDIRSGSCAEAGMKPAVDAVAVAFKAAGMTHVRCLEQSGTVAFDRPL